jgi:hypothetical protein
MPFPNPESPEFVPSPSGSPVANSCVTEQTMSQFSNLQLQEIDWELEANVSEKELEELEEAESWIEQQAWFAEQEAEQEQFL